MSSSVRILHLEDVAADAEIVRATLTDAGLDCTITHVDNAGDFRAALDNGTFDVVLADPSRSGFNGQTALRESRARHPELPFVFVCGALGEDTAVELLEEGGTGYVSKQRLYRLAPVVKSALREAEDRERRREAEGVLRESHIEGQLLRAQRMESIGTLAGGIAHDLNNVLAPILMAVDILRRRVADDRSQKLLSTLEASAVRGGEIVKQILGFARGLQGDRVALQSRHLLRDVTKLIQETFPKTIEIRTDFPGDLWTLAGDATELHQVLLSLCLNARDAMPQGGLLSLAGANVELDARSAEMHRDAKPGPYVVLSVSDTGAGIPEAILERIFEPFVTTKEMGKGAGGGLSTSLAIAKNHGGFIDVHSEVGQGAVFKVYLPAPRESSQVVHPDVLGELPRGQGELILVVGDEEPILELARAALEANGYQVATAASGSAAVAFYARSGGEVAAVVTDMRMPVMDGPATMKALRELNPSVKILASSDLGEGNGGAGDGFLRKPYTTRELLTTLRCLLSGSSKPRPE